ncbi:MAG: hydantoinase B/oxoprolinase family protein [Chloroflexi bacterium]|nr:hydantoinase B/oxoprolinase family protein [Chloroflexota bacterium]
METLDGITLNIWWSRLTSIVDEMAATIERTAFSSVVRESNDYCCALLDANGDLIAQNSKAIPAFIGTMSYTVREFLKVFASRTLKPGDVIITNNPWIASGHLPDLTMALPVFSGKKHIGFCGLTFHMPDVGGRSGVAADTTDHFQEGLKIPIVKLYSKGQIEKAVVDIIKANVRIPMEVMGDIEAAVTAAKTGESRLCDFMQEYSLSDLKMISRSVQKVSERAMREAISKIPAGVYSQSLTFDGWDTPLNIEVSIKVDGDEMVVDYSGTSPQVDYGINSVYNYTYAFTIYAIKCAVCPFVPNNEGSCRPIKVIVPEGSVLNPRYPAPVSARFLSGHFVHAAVLGALAKVIPDKVNAESSAPFWGMMVQGRRGNGEIYVTTGLLANGGQGASALGDGISCLCIPSNVGNTLVESTETTTGLRVTEKEFLMDSGGPGQYRGGLAQRVTVESVSSYPTDIFLLTERLKNPARGYMGGKDGTCGAIFKNGEPIAFPKGQIRLNKGDTVTLILPGGGGYGKPELRERSKVQEDVLNGFVSPEQAKREYGYSSEGHQDSSKA